MLESNIIETNLKFKDPRVSERYSTEMIILDDLTDMKVDKDASAKEINSYFIKDWNKNMGYHYIVRKDGSIERGLPQWAKATTISNQDWRALNVLICGKFNDEELTKEQIECTSILLANQTSKFNLQTDANHIFSKQAFVNSLSPGKHLNEIIETLIGKANWYRYQGGPQINNTPKFSDDMLSEHFSKSEFWCHGQEQGTCSCNHSLNINPRLINLLEQLRANIGGLPLYVNSGYRCPVHNAAVGGVSNSQHMLGNAADIARPTQLSFEDFRWYVEQLPFDGIGLYYAGDFIHCDVRHGGIGSNIVFYGA